MDWRQKTTDERDKVDASQDEAVTYEAIVRGRMHCVRWDDLLVEATTLPTLKKTSRDFIKLHLGYLPADHVLMPYEPYIRALIESYRNNTLAVTDVLDQVEDHIKLIRNADMRYNTCQSYDAAIYRSYNKTFVPYGYAVKNRLTGLLGYEPKLEHSVIAEMWLRDIMAHDEQHFPTEMTSYDWRALTLIKYREVLLEHGQLAADASSLVRIEKSI